MYTSEQIGDIQVTPITPKTKSQYSLVIIQPGNEQVTVLEPCSQQAGAQRVREMVRRGVDPFDIRFTFRQHDQTQTDGLPLRHVNEALWWTKRDFADALAKNELSDEAISLSERYFSSL